MPSGVIVRTNDRALRVAEGKRVSGVVDMFIVLSGGQKIPPLFSMQISDLGKVFLMRKSRFSRICSRQCARGFTAWGITLAFFVYIV